jgi:uncharacterized protein (DUF433 family)
LSSRSGETLKPENILAAKGDMVFEFSVAPLTPAKRPRGEKVLEFALPGRGLLPYDGIMEPITTVTHATNGPSDGTREAPEDRVRIVRTPGICGGRPRIDGHRITVEDVAIWHERMGMSPDEIVSGYPSITLSDVHAALAYYYEEPRPRNFP